MQMRHAFASVFAVIDDEAESVFVQSKFARDFTRLQKQMAQHLMILRFSLSNSRDGFLGDDENVRGRLWVDVIEGQHQVVLIDDVRGYFTGDDFLEERHATRSSA